MNHVGADPIAWVERLQEVNQGSGFTEDEKRDIDNALRTLKTTLRWRQHARGCAPIEEDRI